MPQFITEMISGYAEPLIYDYAKKEYLPASQVPPRSCIPQVENDDFFGIACQNMFTCRLMLGDDERHAAIYVLEAITKDRKAAQ